MVSKGLLVGKDSWNVERIGYVQETLVDLSPDLFGNILIRMYIGFWASINYDVCV